MSYAGDLTPHEAWKLLEDEPGALLVDVRTEAEWRYVGIPDASRLGKKAELIEWVSYPAMSRNEDFLAQLQATGVAPGQPIVFLCRSGQRSIGAAQAATAAGLGPAYNILEGFEGATDEHGHRGWQGWKGAGLPWHQG
ncbi:rhodanese-like domain-containing protein [Demequina rhizosphaerae]|uniref:rhodanese-like domain-containing protein n=1 Tax=Demequina rhizosphaerae TaxID=1638985 RepID=UPI0007836764|nr:rhodanese-like domain-containing protein [Demequina rhizosphaerae]